MASHLAEKLELMRVVCLVDSSVDKMAELKAGQWVAMMVDLKVEKRADL